MFQRLLSLIGLAPSLPSLSGRSLPDQDSLEVDGAATVAFLSGRQTPLSEAEMAESGETADEQRARITERDLVWPGRSDPIHITNPAEIAYRYDLTLTDLDPALYVRRPAVGGVWQAEGGTLLQPGEEAEFEVLYVPPPTGDKTRLRTFSIVLTQFDPRRSADPGQIVQEQPSRWVALPGPGDLAITASPPETIIRPWRRQALLAVHLANRSFLPSSVDVAVVRAGSKEALVKDPETVATISQPLPARTPGVWNVLMPAAPVRGSYLASVTGTMRVTEQIAYPLTLPRPVLVRYVPWLRMGRDWLFLVGALSFLVWLFWGVPVHRQPVIAVTLVFDGLEAGQIPDGASLKDLSPTLTLLDKDTTPLAAEPPVAGSFNGRQLIFKTPGGWFGYRWPFGWNGASRSSQRYQLSLLPRDGKEAEFGRYALPSPSDTLPLDVASASSVFGEWRIEPTIRIARSPGAVVRIQVGDLGGLRNKNIKLLTVNYEIDGQSQPPRILPLYGDSRRGYKAVLLDITDQVPPGKSPLLHVSAAALGVSNDNSVESIPVKRQKNPFTLPESLTFPAVLPLTPAQIADAEKAQAQAKQSQDAADKTKAAAAALAKAAAGKAKTDPAKKTPGKPKPEPDKPKPDHPIAEKKTDKPQTDKPEVIQPIIVKPVAVKAAVLTPEDFLLRDNYQAAIDAVGGQTTAYAHAIRAIAYAKMPGQVSLAISEVALADANAATDTDRALALVAHGWILRQQKQFPAARNSFSSAADADPSPLLVKVSVAEGQKTVEDRVIKLRAIQGDLTQAQKTDIEFRVKYLKTIGR